MSKCLFSLHKPGLFNEAMVSLARVRGMVYCSLVFPLEDKVIPGVTGLFNCQFPKKSYSSSVSQNSDSILSNIRYITIYNEIDFNTYWDMVKAHARIGRRYKRAWEKQRHKKQVSLVSIWTQLKIKTMQGKASPAEKRRLARIEETLMGQAWADRYSAHLQQPTEF